MLNHEEQVFARLNEKLAGEDLYLTVIGVGGFVLSHYKMRATQDVDGFFRTTERIRELIWNVGDEFGLNSPDEPWLNNSVQNMNVAPDERICEVLYDFSNLKVLIPPLDYIAGMKLNSARSQDIEDVGAIVKKLEIKRPDDFRKRMLSYGFPNQDESLVLEAFGHAYGMEWLEAYYLANEEEINSRIRNSIQ